MTQDKTDLNTLDLDADVDIETLMARIREHINGSKTSAATKAEPVVRVNQEPTPAGDALKAQAGFNQAVMGSLRMIAQELRRTLEELQKLQEWQRDHAGQIAQLNERAERVAQLNQQVDEQAVQMVGLKEQLNELSVQSAMAIEETKAQAGYLAGLVGNLDSQVVAAPGQLSSLEQKMNHQLNELKIRVLRAERAARASKRPADEPSPVSESDNQHRESGYNPRVVVESLQAVSPNDGNYPAQSFDYFMFLHKLRGSSADIKHRQLAYLDIFLGRENVLDLGCGRGEFIELLSEHGVKVTGIDADEDMVDFCRDRGLPVVRADIFDYLERLSDGTADGIFAAQLVEHLPPRQISRLIDLCERKLKPGGVILAETVNPYCPFALGGFYLDPTHIRPVPPQLLEFYFEQTSFRIESLKFSAPVQNSSAPEVLEVTSELPADISLYQDYAIVAKRL